jgi:hypothetical protein
MPINTEIEGEGYKRLRIPVDEVRDLNVKFERTLSFYEDLDEEFEDWDNCKRRLQGLLLSMGHWIGLFSPGNKEIPYYNTFGDRMMLRGRYRVQFTS